MWQFITDHDGDIITLTLRSDALLEVWRVHMDRYKAAMLIETLNMAGGQSVWINGYTVGVVGNSPGGCLIMVDNGTYVVHKIVLSNGQKQDLISTIQIHIHASELDTRPKDILPPLDDTIAGPWSPEQEKNGRDDLDDTDNADWWKK
jgi:hypothetical protein